MKNLIVFALLATCFKVYSAVPSNSSDWTAKDIFTYAAAINTFDRGAIDDEEIAFYLTHGDNYLASPGCGRILINNNNEIQTSLKAGYNINKIALVEGISQLCLAVGISKLSKMDFIRVELTHLNQISKQIWVGSCQVNDTRSIWKMTTLGCNK